MENTISDFTQYIQKNGGAWLDWYVGVTDDPRTRLFSAHNVSEASGAWIHRNVGTETARATEKYFLDQGCDGGAGGGTNMSKFVYAYKKTTVTKENN